MPSNLSIARRRKAYDEGRRSAVSQAAENPYDHPKLRQLWELGRTQQQSGELKTPVPPRKGGHGQAARAPRAQGSRPKSPPRRPGSSGGRGGGFGGGGGGYGGGGGGGGFRGYRGRSDGGSGGGGGYPRR